MEMPVRWAGERGHGRVIALGGGRGQAGAARRRRRPPPPPGAALCVLSRSTVWLFFLSLLSSVGGAAVATAAAAMRLQLQLRPLAARREKNKLTVVRLPAPAAVSDPRKLLMRCRILSIDIDCCTICSRSVERQAYFDSFCATRSSTTIPPIDDRCGTWKYAHLSELFGKSYLVPCICHSRQAKKEILVRI